MNKQENRREPTDEERARMLEFVDQHLASVLPGPVIDFEIKGERVYVAQRWLYFREYDGPGPGESFGRLIVADPDRPFAELQVVKRLMDEGWCAGWQWRPHDFISSWEPTRTSVLFTRAARTLLARIDKRAGPEAVGAWEVLAWRRKPRFISVRRDGSDVTTLTAAQLAWRAAALAEGVPSSAFEIWRWFGGSLQGRVLRLTMYSYDKLDGWIDLRDGRLIESKPGTRAILDHYRPWGPRTEADLMWLTFVRNSDGITWCGLEERDASVFDSRRITT